MGKYSTKGLHVNPKKKKTNKNHKQRYFKKENKKIDKSNFYEITGTRDELKNYLNQEFEVQAFITNTYKYSGEKRLLSSVVLPIEKDGKKLYVNHLWVKSERTKNISHGFKKLKVKVVKYKDYYNNSFKYGVRVIEYKK